MRLLKTRPFNDFNRAILELPYAVHDTPAVLEFYVPLTTRDGVAVESLERAEVQVCFDGMGCVRRVPFYDEVGGILQQCVATAIGFESGMLRCFLPRDLLLDHWSTVKERWVREATEASAAAP